jgi:hypothetical protein
MNQESEENLMHTKRVWLIIVFLGVSLLAGACAPKSAASDEMWRVPDAPMAESYEMGVQADFAFEEESSLVSGLGESAKAIERMVIYNADMRISVEDPEITMQKIIDIAEQSGGFVVSSNLYKTNTDRGSLPTASIMVRVPAGRLNSIMDSIKDLTPNPREDIISENISGQDVTAEFTDLESRLRNLEAAEKALAELMEEAKDPQDVLDIFGELTYYRGEIEIVKGRMRYLEESAALSALSVDIIAKRSLQPIEIVGWEPKGTVKAAVEALIEVGQSVVDSLIWFGIFCLPFLIPLGIVVYFLVRYFLKRRAQKKAAKAELETLTQPEDVPGQDK